MMFRGKYSFLSNFYDHPIEYEGVLYKTTEHAYQALKFSDQNIRQEIMDAPTPGMAKIISRKYSDKVDPGQVAKKLEIMYDLNRIKFSDPELARKLSEIDEPIVEGNFWGDTFWGVDVKTGRGKNNLGKILERIKKENEIFN